MTLSHPFWRDFVLGERPFQILRPWSFASLLQTLRGHVGMASYGTKIIPINKQQAFDWTKKLKSRPHTQKKKTPS